MSIDESEIKKIATLGCIDISSDEIAIVKKDLNGIFDFVEKLSSVNTDNVPPMLSVIPDNITMRADVANTKADIKDKIFTNAPKSEYGYFVVPKVIE